MLTKASWIFISKHKIHAYTSLLLQREKCRCKYLIISLLPSGCHRFQPFFHWKDWLMTSNKDLKNSRIYEHCWHSLLNKTWKSNIDSTVKQTNTAPFPLQSSFYDLRNTSRIQLLQFGYTLLSISKSKVYEINNTTIYLSAQQFQQQNNNNPRTNICC